MRLLYQIGTELYFFAARLSALWNKKAKLFVEGRKSTWDKLQAFNAEQKEVYWFHCASLGEFEQARPLIEKLKALKACKVGVTFFSPSGYEIRKNYEHADLIIYLPKDSKKNARKLLNKLTPSKIFFVKYEFWPNYLLEAKKQNIDTYLVSGVFRPNQIFFKWYGGFMRKVLKSFDLIFLQNLKSEALLDQINIKSLVTGDTRFDRVMDNAQNVKTFPVIEAFVDGKTTMVLGSCWPEDERVIFPILNQKSDLKLIVAPHEITENHLVGIEQALKMKTIRFSKVEKESDLSKFQVLIIDNIGMLMHLYQYAKVAYVGGAFGKGLHNILEPASFGVPVIFGDNYAKFPEAFQFMDEEIGFSISNSSEFEGILNQLLKTDYSAKVIRFMEDQKGATEKILSKIL
ncbi:MAG: 3-deoxy-D-manno-octulosonic acid transferase [Putridiphycobacter sp.]